MLDKGGPSERPDEPTLEQLTEAKDLARKSREKGAEVQPITELPPDTVQRDYEQDIKLKRMYGRTLLTVMTVQLGVADLLFFLYAVFGLRWAIQTSVMQTWLAATVVEVIGIALVVTRYLFPRRDQP